MIGVIYVISQMRPAGFLPRIGVRNMLSRERGSCVDSVKVFYLDRVDFVGEVEAEDTGVEVHLSFQ